jgi:hypothetical protein
MGQVFMPINLFSIIGLFCLSNYLLMRWKMDGLITTSQILFNTVICYMLVLWKKGVFTLQLSQKILKGRKDQATNRYSRALVKSCRPLPICVGPFFNLTNNVVLGSGDAVFSYTISLLLASKKEK